MDALARVEHEVRDASGKNRKQRKTTLLLVLAARTLLSRSVCVVVVLTLCAESHGGGAAVLPLSLASPTPDRFDSFAPASWTSTDIREGS
jgi:hypothetical protein